MKITRVLTMTRPDLRALAEAELLALTTIDTSQNWKAYDVDGLEAFARTVAAAERARIVAAMRARVSLLQTHGQELAANAMENLADELERGS
jgi:hypothetical protein